MNIELLEQTANRILNEITPEEFDMKNYIIVGGCGTTACIAGHALLLSGFSPQEINDMHPPFDVAQERLELSEDQAFSLFFVDDWPEQFAYKYEQALAFSRERREVAADRIRHFIETKGKE